MIRILSASALALGSMSASAGAVIAPPREMLSNQPGAAALFASMIIEPSPNGTLICGSRNDYPTANTLPASQTDTATCYSGRFQSFEVIGNSNDALLRDVQVSYRSAGTDFVTVAPDGGNEPGYFRFAFDVPDLPGGTPQDAYEIRIQSSFVRPDPFVPVSYSLYLYGITMPGDVPEPATWAMMLGGFGTAGAALRRRRRAVLTPTP